jgi:hypothetical protein
MKIGVLCRHWGLQDYLKGVLVDYEVNYYSESTDFSKIKGEEDLYIVTLPSTDILPILKFNKPIISYPCLSEYGDADYVKPYYELVKYPKFRFILNHSSWAKEWHQLFPDFPIRYIPYAFHHFPKWHGSDRKVIVVIRKPERLLSYTEKSIEDLLKGIPYELHTGELTKRELLERMASCQVMFYFSNASWGLVFCEALSIGLPMVTVNEHQTGDYANIACPIDQVPYYLQKVLNDKDLANQYSLRNLELADEILNYKRIKELWRINIEEMLNE